MDKNVRRVLLLVFLIVIPFLIYAFLQVKSLEQDEKRANSIYEKQMDAVLFSLNQYADDITTQWIRQLSKADAPISGNAFELVLGNESIQMLVLRQLETKKDSIFLNDYVQLNEEGSQKIKNWYLSKDTLFTQLEHYLSVGFQKIQSADNWVSLNGLKPAQEGITVMVYDQDSVLYNALFIFEPTYWAEQLLGDKMQEIATDEFRLAVLQSSKELKTPRIIYSTTPFNTEKKYAQKDLWILPNMQLVIQPNGVSYSELIRKRSKNNLYILFFSVLTLIIGTFIMIRNIRSALKIAQLKSDFVSNVSHEIRTPLSLIKMYAETLMLGRLPTEEKKQQYYEVIHHQSGRLTYLVNNILDFSRIEANQKTYSKVDMDMNQLTQQLYDNYAPTFKKQGINCTLTLSSVPILVSVDTQAFHVALSNLVENAIKFSDKEKTIHISTTIENGFGCCSVSDQGIGIPKKLQNKIFDKFYRAESALTQKTKGAGLGLSLVKHIMDAHEGKLTVSSEVDKGSIFTLKFLKT